MDFQTKTAAIRYLRTSSRLDALLDNGTFVDPDPNGVVRAYQRLRRALGSKGPKRSTDELAALRESLVQALATVDQLAQVLDSEAGR